MLQQPKLKIQIDCKQSQERVQSALRKLCMQTGDLSDHQNPKCFILQCSPKYNQMLQEAKSLQHRKVYLSNRSLRVHNFQDEPQHEPPPLDSKLSFLATNNNSISPQPTPKMLIGDADTFFLMRQNEKYQQEINQLIDEMQTNNMQSFDQRCRNQQLEKSLDFLRTQNSKNSTRMHLLRKISGKLVRAVKQKSIVIINMANIIKKLEKSMQNLTRQLQISQANNIAIEQKYIELQHQIRVHQERMRNKLQVQMQTEKTIFDHFALQTECEQKIYSQTSTQSQKIDNQQQQTQTSILYHEQQTNTTQVKTKDTFCSTQQTILKEISLQIGSSIFALQQNIQQTDSRIMSQSATQHERALSSQAEVQSQQLEQSHKTNEIPPVQMQQTMIQTDRNELQKLRIYSAQIVRIEPRIIQYSDCFTQSNIESCQNQTQTASIPTDTTSIMTQITRKQEQNTQTEYLAKLNLQQHQINYLINQINHEIQEQSIHKKQLNISLQVSLQIQQNCQNTFETQVTEEDDLSLKMNFPDKEVNQNIIGYFRQISSTKNQISYNQKIVKDLEEKGQNQASKALARLMKQHMYLKVCLTRLIQKQGQQVQSQNEKIMQILQQSMQNVQSPGKKGSPSDKQCTIY